MNMNTGHPAPSTSFARIAELIVVCSKREPQRVDRRRPPSVTASCHSTRLPAKKMAPAARPIKVCWLLALGRCPFRSIPVPADRWWLWVTVRGSRARNSSNATRRIRPHVDAALGMALSPGGGQTRFAPMSPISVHSRRSRRRGARPQAAASSKLSLRSNPAQLHRANAGLPHN